MFYKFQKSGKYIGICETKEPYSTDVAPPDDNSKQWVWNGFSWVGVHKSLDMEYDIKKIASRVSTSNPILVEDVEDVEESVVEESNP